MEISKTNNEQSFLIQKVTSDNLIWLEDHYFILFECCSIEKVANFSWFIDVYAYSKHGTECVEIFQM